MSLKMGKIILNPMNCEIILEMQNDQLNFLMLHPVIF